MRMCMCVYEYANVNVLEDNLYLDLFSGDMNSKCSQFTFSSMKTTKPNTEIPKAQT